MGLDLWFREDVVRILASTQETMRSSIAASRPLDVAVADSYRDGFDDALRSVAVAFGICAPVSTGQAEARTGTRPEGRGRPFAADGRILSPGLVRTGPGTGGTMTALAGHESERGGAGTNLRHMGLALGLTFVVVLAIVVAKQMSTEAMAVVVGVVCGVLASIPTSVLLLVVLIRRDGQQREEAGRRRDASRYAPVVVIQGGQPQSLRPGHQPGYWPDPPPGPAASRQFHVVGGEDLLGDEGGY